MVTVARYVSAAADFWALPHTLTQAMLRSVVLMIAIFGIVLLDKYFDSATPAAVFGYALGSLTTYGSMRKRPA